MQGPFFIMMNHKYVKVLLSFILLGLSDVTSAQMVTRVNDVYVDESGNKYTGIYISYYKGNLKEAVYSVKEGKEEGTVEFFYPGGEIMEQGNFRAGKKDGKWTRWSEQGDKLAEAYYKDGIKDGKWIIWDENGTMRYEMHYFNGAKSGTWVMWDQDGNESGRKTY